MTDSKTDSVWQFMSEYALEVDPASINVDFTCGICKKLMIDACQTVCGCQYCYKCIGEYGDKYCPGQKEDCKVIKLKLDKHVHKNELMNTKIMSVKVRCPNRSCVCNIVLTQMEDHLRVCTKQKTECPFVQIGCDNEGASKDVIVTHLQNETFTHFQLLIELIHNLKNEVDGLKDKSGISQLEISSLREELTMKDVQIEKIKIQMDDQKREIEEQKRELDCLKEESRDRKNLMTTLEKELGELRNETEIRKREMTVEMEEEKRETEVVKKESKKRESAMRTLEEELGKLRNEAEIRKREITAQMEEQKRETEVVKEESKKRESAMRTLEEELGKLRNEAELRVTAMIGETEKREREMGVQRRSIDDVRNEMREEREKFDEDRERRMRNWVKWNKLLPNIDVDFVWRIDECTKKMAMMKGQWIYSESFHSNNYKLCLYIYIWNDSDNIQLYCMIMRGDNDDKVQWPMSQRVTLSIVNQDTLRTHKSGTTTYDTDTYDNKSLFNRPMTDMNEDGIWVTESSFIKYSSIKNDKSVVVNDSIIVSCVLGDRT